MRLYFSLFCWIILSFFCFYFLWTFPFICWLVSKRLIFRGVSTPLITILFCFTLIINWGASKILYSWRVLKILICIYMITLFLNLLIFFCWSFLFLPLRFIINFELIFRWISAPLVYCICWLIIFPIVKVFGIFFTVRIQYKRLCC